MRGVNFDGRMFGSFSWLLVFVGVILMLHALRLRGCLAMLVWFLVGVALVGVFWMPVYGVVRS